MGVMVVSSTSYRITSNQHVMAECDGLNAIEKSPKTINGLGDFTLRTKYNHLILNDYMLLIIS